MPEWIPIVASVTVVGALLAGSLVLGVRAGAALQRAARARGLDYDRRRRVMRGTYKGAVPAIGYRVGADPARQIEVLVTPHNAGDGAAWWWLVEASYRQPLPIAFLMPAVNTAGVDNAIRYVRDGRARGALREAEDALRAAAKLGLRFVDERGMQLSTSGDPARLWEALDALSDLAAELTRTFASAAAK